MKILSTFLLILTFTLLTFGQAFVKGDNVVPKFPADALSFDKLKIWSMRNQYKAMISEVDGKYYINNKDFVVGNDFPLLLDLQIKEYEQSKKKEHRILLIAQGTQIEILIPNNLDIQKVLSSLLFKGYSSEFTKSEYFQNLEKLILPTVFTDNLSEIPYETQQNLIKNVGYTRNFIWHKTFKEKSYLSVKMPSKFVYNTIQLNSSERAARHTEEALKRVKELYKILGETKSIDGLCISSVIFSKDFLRDRYNNPAEESYEFYVSIETLKKFLDAEITNQELIDSSIILVNDSRVKLNMAN